MAFESRLLHGRPDTRSPEERALEMAEFIVRGRGEPTAESDIRAGRQGF